MAERRRCDIKNHVAATALSIEYVVIIVLHYGEGVDVNYSRRDSHE